MEGYRKNIVFSWIFLLLAAVTWIELNPDYFVWKIFAFLALIPRINQNEKERFDRAMRKNTLSVKFGFIYMLGWLCYILYSYFNNLGSGNRILNELQLIVFVAPLIATLVLSEFKWYLSYNEKNKT